MTRSIIWRWSLSSLMARRRYHSVMLRKLRGSSSTSKLIKDWQISYARPVTGENFQICGRMMRKEMIRWLDWWRTIGVKVLPPLMIFFLLWIHKDVPLLKYLVMMDMMKWWKNLMMVKVFVPVSKCFRSNYDKVDLIHLEIVSIHLVR